MPPYIHCSLAYVRASPTPCRTRARKPPVLPALFSAAGHAKHFPLTRTGLAHPGGHCRQPLGSRLDRSMNTMLREVHCRGRSSCSSPSPPAPPWLPRHARTPTTTRYIRPPPVAYLRYVRPYYACQPRRWDASLSYVFFLDRIGDVSYYTFRRYDRGNEITAYATRQRDPSVHNSP